MLLIETECIHRSESPIYTQQVTMQILPCQLYDSESDENERYTTASQHLYYQLYAQLDIILDLLQQRLV